MHPATQSIVAFLHDKLVKNRKGEIKTFVLETVVSGLIGTFGMVILAVGERADERAINMKHAHAK